MPRRVVIPVAAVALVVTVPSIAVAVVAAVVVTPVAEFAVVAIVMVVMTSGRGAEEQDRSKQSSEHFSSSV